MQRRSLLQSAGALSLLGLGACATTSIPAKAQVVVIGGAGVWVRQGRYRRAARQARSEARRLNAEGDRLRAQTSSLVALSRPQPDDDRRAA